MVITILLSLANLLCPVLINRSPLTIKPILAWPIVCRPANRLLIHPQLGQVQVFRGLLLRPWPSLVKIWAHKSMELLIVDITRIEEQDLPGIRPILAGPTIFGVNKEIYILWVINRPISDMAVPRTLVLWDRWLLVT